MQASGTMLLALRVPVRRRGATLVWVAISLIVFVGMVALALDWGYAYWTAQKLQNAADAAALAGAREVWFSHANARAKAIAIAAENEAAGESVQLADNPANDPDGDVVIGVYDAATRTFTPSLDPNAANAVTVQARRTEDSLSGPLQLIWGGIFGITQTQLTRWGIAFAEGGPTYADIIALNPHDPASFHIYGNGYLDLGDGTVQVNSDSAEAAMYQGTKITFHYDEVNIVGGFNERGNPKVEAEGDQNSGQPYVSDPLAALPEPQPGTPMSPSGITEAAEYWPGYYPDGLDLNDGDATFLHPGVYILDNGFSINGQAPLTGYGVMFFIRSGQVHQNGGSEVRLTPPADGIYKGIQFFQARDNTEYALFNGTGLMTGSATDDPATPDIDESTAGCGQFYFPAATVEMGGTGDMYVSGVIADKVIVRGDGHKTVTSGWDGDKGGDKVWLVE